MFVGMTLLWKKGNVASFALMYEELYVSEERIELSACCYCRAVSLQQTLLKQVEGVGF